MVLNNDSSFLAKKIIYRKFQNQDQTQIESLVSTGLRNTAINQDIYIRERIEKYINESLQNDLGNINEYFKSGYFLVAEYQNEVIGSLGAIPESNSELRLKRMSVKKEFRRQGIAKNLLERIEKWALKHNFKEIILGTSEIQKDATRFWVDSGFKLIKKEKMKGTNFFGLSFKKQIYVSEF